jgi:CheY-like chemotaxis protein
LVVDDDAVNQKVAQRWLQRLNCEVTIASDGADAVRLATAQRFDLVLMDLQMPGMDGYEAARRIRATQHSERTPIIALTGEVDPRPIALAREAGMDDYLAKPIEIEKLRLALARFLPEMQRARTARAG